LQGFINQFGDANAKGVYAISSLHTSLLSSLAFIGKFAGCFFAGPLIERWGHRVVFLILAAVSYVGIVSAYNYSTGWTIVCQEMLLKLES
jgi:MFS family permease